MNAKTDGLPRENSSYRKDSAYIPQSKIIPFKASCRKAQLSTITMAELYDNVYQSRPPVIDDLLYTGTYIFAGAPKVGKSFFMAQLA